MTFLRLSLALLAATLGFASNESAASAQTKGNTTAPAKTSKHKSVKRRVSHLRGQKAPTPERIAEIQQALARDGSYTGTPNRKWDAASVEAMKRFQAAHGLNPTGKIDALSLQKLGLGSEITGVAAPTPATAASVAAPVAERQQP